MNPSHDKTVRLVLSRLGSLLYTSVVESPIPSVVVTMFNAFNSLFIFPPLLSFMLRLNSLVWRSTQVKIQTSLNDLSNLSPCNPFAEISSRAPGSELAVLNFRDSPVSGCNWGSTTTLLKPQLSLCHKEGNPSLGQDKACSTAKKTSTSAQGGRTSRNNVEQQHHGKQFCAKQNCDAWEEDK